MTQKLTLPIQVGKKYVRRDGKVITVKQGYEDKTSICVFVGEGEVHQDDEGEEHAWTKTGKIFVTKDSPYDVVADYIEGIAHPHAEAMMEYAKDAAKSVNPWLDWEYKHPGCDWRDLRDHPVWGITYGYRRKQPKVVINGIECVAGVKDPVFDERYYVASITHRDYCWSVRYTGAYKSYADRGLVHSTKEDAIAMAKAMLNF